MYECCIAEAASDKPTKLMAGFDEANKRERVSEPGLSLSPPQSSAKSRIFYGWYIVACGWVSLLLGYGVMLYAPLILLNSWNKAFGWGRGTLSSAYSIGLLTVAISSPFVGKLTDAHGSRKLMFLGSIVLGVGVLLLRWMTESWQLYAVFMLAVIGMVGGRVLDPVKEL